MSLIVRVPVKTGVTVPRIHSAIIKAVGHYHDSKTNLLLRTYVEVTCLLLSRPDFELDLTQKAVSDEEVYDGTETIFCGRDYSEAA